MVAPAMLLQTTSLYGRRDLQAVCQAHGGAKPLLPTCKISIPTRARCAHAAIEVVTPGANISSVARKGQQIEPRLCDKVSCLVHLTRGCVTFSILNQQLLQFPSDYDGTLQYVLA